MSNMFSFSQSEPARTNAPVGYSVHRMGCVFHPIPDPALTSIVPQSAFFWLLTFGSPLFFGPFFFPQT
jgi:hypothetical protein